VGFSFSFVFFLCISEDKQEKKSGEMVVGQYCICCQGKVPEQILTIAVVQTAPEFFVALEFPLFYPGQLVGVMLSNHNLIMGVISQIFFRLTQIVKYGETLSTFEDIFRDYGSSHSVYGE
jgi:hypothetical protein